MCVCEVERAREGGRGEDDVLVDTGHRVRAVVVRFLVSSSDFFFPLSVFCFLVFRLPRLGARKKLQNVWSYSRNVLTGRKTTKNGGVISFFSHRRVVPSKQRCPRAFGAGAVSRRGWAAGGGRRGRVGREGVSTCLRENETERVSHVSPR